MQPKVLISEEQIRYRNIEMGKEISRDFSQTKDLIVVGLLKGSFIFMSDLVREIKLPLKVDFMTVSSYGNDTVNKEVRIIKDLDESILDKDVLIVEDIIDSGYTLSKVIQILKSRNPRNLKICTLLDKPSRRKAQIDVDYCGFEVPDEFVVGYGLDYAQLYRNIPYVGITEIG